MPSTPTNVTTPPTGLPLSSFDTVSTVGAGTLLPALRPKAGEPGKLENVKLPAELFNQPTNLQRGGPFYCKFRTGSEAAAAGGAGYGVALFDVPGYLVNIGSEGFVEENHDNGVSAHVAYVAYFDDRPAGSLGQFRGFLDGSFTPLPATPDGLVPLRWYRQGTAELAAAIIRRWDASYSQWQPGQDMKIELSGVDRFFVNKHPAVGGPYPAPTAADQETADWRPAAPPTAAYSLPVANARPGNDKYFRFRYAAEATDAGQGNALENLDFATCVVGQLVTVELYRDSVSGPQRQQQLRVQYWNGTDATAFATGLCRYDGSDAGSASVPCTLQLVEAGTVDAYTKAQADALLAGKADLVGGKVPAAQLPSYVDDVLEYATVAALPSPGETGKIYVITTGADQNKEYRWSGSQYVQLVASPGSTDAVPEGTQNLYFTPARAQAAVQAKQDGQDAAIATNAAAIYGRYRGAWTANTAYKQRDWVIRPDTLVPTAAKADFTSGSSFAAGNWQDILPLGLQLFGDPAKGNLSVGVFGPNNTLGANCRANLFFSNGYHSLGDNCKGNVIGLGNATGTIDLGDNCEGNDIGAAVTAVALGDNCRGNRIGPRCLTVTLGDNVLECRLATSSQVIAIGTGSSDCVIGAGCANVSIGANCQRVRVYQTQGAGPGNPFVVPDGTQDATYVNGVLQASAGGGSGPAYTAGAGIAISAQNVISTTVGAGGIDYANPVTLTQAATLQVNKAYHATGSGYQLTLPDAATAGGGGIFLEIAPDATSLFPLANGSSLKLYAGETMLLRATPSGWKKAGGELLAMVARLETTTGQQDVLPQGVQNTIPLSTLTSLQGPAPLAAPASYALVIQRDGRGTFDFGGVIGQLSDLQGDYTILLERTAPGGAKSNPVVDFFTISPKAGLAVVTKSTTLPVVAGEAYRIVEVAGSGSARLAGQYQTNVFFLNFTEIV